MNKKILSLLTVLMLSCLLVTVKAIIEVHTFDGFEDGTLDAWTYKHVGVKTEYDINSTYAYTGLYGLNITLPDYGDTGNGASNLIYINYTSSNNLTDFTVSFRFKLGESDITGNNVQTICYLRGDTTTLFSFRIAQFYDMLQYYPYGWGASDIHHFMNLTDIDDGEFHYFTVYYKAFSHFRTSVDSLSYTYFFTDEDLEDEDYLASYWMQSVRVGWDIDMNNSQFEDAYLWYDDVSIDQPLDYTYAFMFILGLAMMCASPICGVVLGKVKDVGAGVMFGGMMFVLGLGFALTWILM